MTVHSAVCYFSIWLIASEGIDQLVEISRFATKQYAVVDIVVMEGDAVFLDFIHLLVCQFTREIDEENLELGIELVLTWLEELSLNLGLQSDVLQDFVLTRSISNAFCTTY